MGMNLFHLTDESMRQELSKTMMPGEQFSCPVYVSFGKESLLGSALSNLYGYAAVTDSDCLVVIRYNMLGVEMSNRHYSLRDLESLTVKSGAIISIRLAFASGTGMEQLHLRVSPKVYMSGLTAQKQNLEGLVDTLERWK